MFTILIVVILFCSALSDLAAAKDWEQSEYNAELRHEELLEEIQKLKEPQKNKKSTTTARRTRAIKDSYGRVLVEEILVDSLDEVI